MSMEAQSVLVIQDASSEVCWNAIRWVLQGLSLKTGDMLTLLTIINQVNSHNLLAFVGARKMAGYKSREDAPMLGAVHETVEDLIARKMEEYHNSVEFIQITKLYQTQKVEFKIKVLSAGQSAKVVAVEEARKLSSTWVILDRKIKKDKRYFLEKLSCGISKMNHDNSVEKLRGPKATKITRNFSAPRITRDFSATTFSYDEMLPGSLEGNDLFSIEFLPTGSSPSEESTRSTHSSSSEDVSTAYLNLGEHRRVASEPYGNYLHKTLTCISGTDNFIRCLKPEHTSDISICSICKNRRRAMSESNFCYRELFDATDGFSAKNLISAGEYGAVFRGKLINTSIAIKQQENASVQGEKKFDVEAEVLRNIRHQNVIMLLVSCTKFRRRFLVYEYVCNGSLNQHIADQSCRTLTWTKRLKIALGASRGLDYLHKHNIIHRDIRPKNIFLTHDYEPLLGSFGLAMSQYISDQSSNDKVVGTCGYLAPEYVETGKITTKADVYAFGVVLLELFTGRSITDKRLEEKSLLGWARPLLKERKYEELIDPRIVTPNEAGMFILVIQLTEKCLCKDPQKRSSMEEVVLALEHIMEENNRHGMETIGCEKSDSLSSVSKKVKFQKFDETIIIKTLSLGAESSNNTSQMSGNDTSTSGTLVPGRRSTANSSSPQYKSKSFEGTSKNGPQIYYQEMLN